MKIRLARIDEYPLLTELWLVAFAQSHPFIPAEHRQQQAVAMYNEYLPQSDTWVIAGEHPTAPPLGFISLIGRHIAALFIHPSHQGRGLGTRLLLHAMQRHRSLTLNVYSSNTDAIHFYEYHGFYTTTHTTNPHTAAAEQQMCWIAPPARATLHRTSL